jgi:hypothetical protein
LDSTGLINGVLEKCLKMEKFDEAVGEIISQLASVEYKGDLSDIGNEIGIVIAKHFDEENTIQDFIMGLKHGVSLTDGTHG